MKKHYEKPEIQVVALELSEAIANCAFRPDDLAVIEAASKVGATFAEDCDVPMNAFCYFTSASILANS